MKTVALHRDNNGKCDSLLEVCGITEDQFDYLSKEVADAELEKTKKEKKLEDEIKALKLVVMVLKNEIKVLKGEE